ncbi:hypothetical protein HJG60_011027 [Phyllostomus discolor]|uniref:Uncharacterized protein n=1 Tax=Phyllostomus discolor TaxID=89673 RepID=A0A834EAM3_9CHIR|nr:hypothetical protein HJG60_011027 [Phyllostomus discolor]
MFFFTYFAHCYACFKIHPCCCVYISFWFHCYIVFHYILPICLFVLLSMYIWVASSLGLLPTRLLILSPPSFFFLRFYLFLFRERGREGERERERNVNVRLPLNCPQLGTWPVIWACALTGN